MNPLLAFAIALVGNAILSLGMVLQKRHVAFIGHRARRDGERDAAFQRDRLGWIAGFTLSNLAPPFTFVALLGLPANVVAAINGSNVAFAALFSALLLGERLSRRSLLVSLALFAAIGLAGLRGSAVSGAPSAFAIVLFFALPFVLFGLLLVLRRRGRSVPLAVAVGAVAGALAGFMILPLKALGALPDPSLASWLLSPWLYLYAVSGLSSVAIVQLAYKDGAMNRVAPAFYGFQVLWPAIAAAFAFSLPFDPLQALAFALIAVCVGLIAGGGTGLPRPPSPKK